MDITKVHVPERLEGETQVQYRYRRRMSRAMQRQTTMVHNAYFKGTYFAPGTHTPQMAGSGQRTPKARVTLERVKGVADGRPN